MPQVRKTVRSMWGLGLAAAVVASCLFVLQSPRASADELDVGTAIVVDPDAGLGTVSDDLFGFNQRYENHGTGAYDPATDQFDSNLVTGITASGAGILRFPGGTDANTFHWKNAIGPQSGRSCQLNGYGLGPAASDYGVDEHMRLAETVGADANIVVNFDTGTTEEAADWVEYMNAAVGTNPNGGTAWADVRSANGHPAPYGIKWWELGNEVNGAQTWLGAVPTAQRSDAYAFGGTATFTKAALGSRCDARDTAAVSSGTASQTFYTRYPTIANGSQTVYVDDVAWTEVSDLNTASSTDKVYEVDLDTGAVTFGDNVHGAIPASGSDLRISYTTGPRPGYVDFYSAMKSADPDIDLCWTGNDYHVLGTANLDCVVAHPYSGGGDSSTVQGRYDAAMVNADNAAHTMTTRQANLKAFRPNATYIFSEYSMFFGRNDPGPSPGFLRSVAQGMSMASSLTRWMDLGVPVAEKHPLVNWDPSNPPAGLDSFASRNASPFGFPSDFVPQAAALVNGVFSRTAGDDLISSSVANNPIHDGDGQNDYEALRVVATKATDGSLTTIVVNRDPVNDVSSTILPKHYGYSTSASVTTVNGPDVDSYNDAVNPNNVSSDTQTDSVDQGGFDYTFPAHSITSITLTPNSQSSSPVSIAYDDEVAPEVGGTVNGSVSIHNPGTATTTGTLELVGPTSWTYGLSSAAYNIAPGQSTTVNFTVSVPIDDPGDTKSIALIARSNGVVEGVETTDVSPVKPRVWNPVMTETFDGGTVGQPPAGWVVSGPASSLTVGTRDGDRVLAVNRAVQGSAAIVGSHTFPAISTDAKLSFRVLGDQLNLGLAVQLVDSSANPIARFNLGQGGVFKYSDASAVKSTNMSYVTDQWYQVDLVLDASAGTYDAYVDGDQVVDGADRWPGSSKASGVEVRTGGAGNDHAGSFAIDDLTVSVPGVDLSGLSSVVSDSFDGGTVGQPPAGWTVSGSTGSVLVGTRDGERVLAVDRDATGSTALVGSRTFAPISTDVTTSFRVLGDQLNLALAVQLVDSSANPIARFNLGQGGELKYSDASVVKSTGASYVADRWYQVDVVLDASAGTYDAYVDGYQIVNHADLWPGSSTPSGVEVRTGGPSNDHVGTFAVDDLKVSVP